jgi:ferredoxin
MRGESWIRRQDLQDPLLNRMLLDRGLDDVPFFARRLKAREEHMQRWRDLAPLRDGPVADRQVAVDDPGAMAEAIKAKALDLGADQAGVAALAPDLIEIDKELDHEFAVGIIVKETYAKVLDGPDAVDVEAFRVYARCAEIVTELARYIREELGYPALAHHNGGNEIQALPTLYRAGFGELGKHGSLINPRFGASWRPAFVTTTLPLASDRPIDIGVQDYCMTCRLCATACPGDAVADSADYIVTDGIKRWLIDTEKCYPVSRLRPEYCHICVDVCPYIHKENGSAETKSIFKAFVQARKAAGFDKPKAGAAESDPALAGTRREIDTRV